MATGNKCLHHYRQPNLYIKLHIYTVLLDINNYLNGNVIKTWNI